uniref:ABC-2 type transporter n=1 Tax=Ahnfeltia fastigiata TaxID=31363 RepID=UPI001D10C6DB|nr:ABC-2 type transporter [Ahnfeltia fastigiata]UAT97570.1 ABC-2 type transporter [Ahnfeltia fastigiata]UAT97774.1 ABC-2 type transporter [Ahnfeltia fastigiata]
MNSLSNIALKPKNKISIKKMRGTCLIQEMYALIKRLFIQIKRRPSTLISGIIQPLLWLLLFGALFQNAPVGLFTSEIKYGRFLSPGILIFTAFTGSINAGLPLMFDREFGFLNRLLVSPLISRDSILISSSFFITAVTMLQSCIILVSSLLLFNYVPNGSTIFVILCITLLITFSISSMSIGLAFILPGHIELLAFILIINLPMLFSSTALAPLSFMPYWLQIIASINPLTYAIESIRYISISNDWSIYSIVIKTVWCNIYLNQTLILFIILDILSLIIVKKIISYKFE